MKSNPGTESRKSTNGFRKCWLLLPVIIGALLLTQMTGGFAQTRAIQPVRIETKTPQNEDISYIYAESHALVIGVSKYTNGWRDLPGVENDLRQVSQALEDNGFEVHPVRNPTKDQLKDAIEDFVYRFGAQPDNRVLIYYAGHGHTVELAGERQMGYLVPADAPDPSRDRLAFRRQALSMQEIEVFAKETIAKHALFMFDACFAGSVFEAVRAAPKHIQRRTREPVRYFITSGSANQEVPDNSIFRQAFLEALRGEVDSDRDGYFTGSELGDYIYRRTVESIPNLDPQYGKLQDRNLNRGDFVFEIRQPHQALANAPASSREIAAQAWGMIEQS